MQQAQRQHTHPHHIQAHILDTSQLVKGMVTPPNEAMHKDHPPHRINMHTKSPCLITTIPTNPPPATTPNA